MSKHLARALAMILAGFILAGCEDDTGDLNSQTNQAGAPTSAETSVPVEADPYFPDGLHPNSAASRIIAQRFSSHITPVSGETIVCLGDSITAAGYPGILAGLTGMNVSNQGHGGETSAGGAARAAGAIGSAKYVCILYGANDVIHGNPASGIAANIARIVESARAAGAVPVVGTLTPMSGDYAQYSSDARAASAAIRSTAGANGVAVADLENAF